MTLNDMNRFQSTLENLDRTLRSANTSGSGGEGPGNNKLNSLYRDIKKGKLKLPTLKTMGDKIIHALNLCAEHYPGLAIPYTHLYMLVHDVGSLPRADTRNVLEFRKKISPQRARMRAKFKRDIVVLRGEGTVRATVGDDGNDLLVNVAAKQARKVFIAIETQKEIDGLFDANKIKPTEQNRDILSWYKASIPVLERASKQMPPMLTSGEDEKKGKKA